MATPQELQAAKQLLETAGYKTLCTGKRGEMRRLKEGRNSWYGDDYEDSDYETVEGWIDSPESQYERVQAEFCNELGWRTAPPIIKCWFERDGVKISHVDDSGKYDGSIAPRTTADCIVMNCSQACDCERTIQF